MSDLVFTDFDDFSDISYYESMERTQPKKERAKKFMAVKIILSVFLVLLLGESIVYLFVTPALSAPAIKYNLIEKDEIQYFNNQLGEMTQSSWVKFDASRALSIISSVSCVESASVEKKFPNTVSINIKKREAVARVIANINGRSVPIQIDQNGVLFSQLTGFAGADVPLISGIPLENLQQGMRVPPKFRALLEQIGSLPKQYFSAISEIKIVTKEYGTYELVLYPVKARVRVLTDHTLNEEVLRYMIVVLDVVNSIEPDVAEIDLRYGSVSYRKK